ncbi:MAG TPA: hypothetical protein VFQ57_05635, partial [Sphingomonas sp.]|nr:hypothetical protein [Sphingomonas sp.]
MTADAAYGQLTDQRAAVALAQGRVHQRMTGMLYNAYQALVLDGASREARAAADQAEEDHRQALQRLDDADAALPGDSMTGRLRRDLDALHKITQPALEMALQNRDAEATQMLRAGDAMDKTYSPDLRAYLTARSKDNRQISSDLSATARSTRSTLWMLAIGSILVVGGIAIWITRKAITGPLSRL